MKKLTLYRLWLAKVKPTSWRPPEPASRYLVALLKISTETLGNRNFCDVSGDRTISRRCDCSSVNVTSGHESTDSYVNSGNRIHSELRTNLSAR